MAVLLHWRNMIFEPTETKRNVLIAVIVDHDNQRITKIAALFCAQNAITEGLFDDGDEAALLLRFWQSIRCSDRIFSSQVLQQLQFVRERSWTLGLLHSNEIDLRQVYLPSLHDTQEMGAQKSPAVLGRTKSELGQTLA